MRIGVACVMQESNTFAPTHSTLNDFFIEEGEAILRTNRRTNTEVAGFLEELDRLNLEPIPLLSAWAIAGGLMEDSSFDSLANVLLDRIERVQFDGLLVALHGAWVSESHPSADAELVKRVRSKLGPNIPIVATLDLHANVRPSLLAEIQGLVGYRTYPHVDMAETGRKATRLLHRILAEHLRPHLYWLPIPMLCPAQNATTDRPPIKDVFEQLDRQFPVDTTLNASFFCVQPWLDVDGVAGSVVVVTTTVDSSVPPKMQAIMQQLWDHRSMFEVAWVQPEELVQRILRESVRPVIVSESYDGMTGGAPGDHPGLLTLVLPHRERLSGCLYIVDPEAAGKAHEAGLGRRFSGTLGAKKDSRFGSPVPVDALVRSVSDGIFTLKGPVFTGKTVEMGPTAVLEIGRLNVVVGSRPVIAVDPELYRSQQIEPAQQDMVAVKSPGLFRPGYASMLHTVLDLDMPGVCQGNLRKLAFRTINRPMWPLDEFDWKASHQGAVGSQRQ